MTHFTSAPSDRVPPVTEMGRGWRDGPRAVTGRSAKAVDGRGGLSLEESDSRALTHEFRRAYDAWDLVPAGLAARPRRGYFFPRHARRPRHQARRILHRRAEPVPAREGRVRSPSSQLRSEQARRCGLRRLRCLPRCEGLSAAPVMRTASVTAGVSRGVVCLHSVDPPDGRIRRAAEGVQTGGGALHRCSAASCVEKCTENQRSRSAANRFRSKYPPSS